MIFYRCILTFVAKDLKELIDYANTPIVPLSHRHMYWRRHPASINHELIVEGKHCFSIFFQEKKHKVFIVCGE